MFHPEACNTFNFVVLVENANRLTNSRLSIRPFSFIFTYLYTYSCTFLPFLLYLSKKEILKRKGCRTKPDTNLKRNRSSKQTSNSTSVCNSVRCDRVIKIPCHAIESAYTNKRGIMKPRRYNTSLTSSRFVSDPD